MSTAEGPRRIQLRASRSLLDRIPLNVFFELPGKPHVVYQMRSYASLPRNEQSATDMAAMARADLPFVFKAFEMGQIGPKKLAKMHWGAPRVATIHEYLDWTFTCAAAETDGELVREQVLHGVHGMGCVASLAAAVAWESVTSRPCLSPCHATPSPPHPLPPPKDFAGFRVLCIFPRYVPQWPPQGYTGCNPGVKPAVLSAPLNPWPILQTHSKPVCAATIRWVCRTFPGVYLSQALRRILAMHHPPWCCHLPPRTGPGYLEVPFVATQEGKRGKGYCRYDVDLGREGVLQVLRGPWAF